MLLIIRKLSVRSLILFHVSCDNRQLHSFPTRRSSDLTARMRFSYALEKFPKTPCWRTCTAVLRHRLCVNISPRSEEHTSELQSQSNLVCRLLLEKKKLMSLATNVAFDAVCFYSAVYST